MSRGGSRGNILFILALVVALCAQGFIVLSPILQRDMPVELDDALVYEVKAAQLETCIWQDCPGLTSLREQLKLEGRDYVDWPEFRMARSFLHIYHPGHSLVLSALHRTGLSWEAAFDFSRVAGSLFIVCSIAFWAFAFFGRTTATVFLLLFAVTLFPEQGIHMVTPGSLTSGVAFLMLGLVCIKSRFVEPALVVGTAVMLSLHTIAILLAPFVWGFYFFQRRWPLHKPAVIGAALSAALVVATFAAQKLISVPMFHLPADYRPDDAGLWDQVIQNVRVAGSTVQSWFLRFGFGDYAILPVGLFCLWGFSRLDHDRRRIVLIFGTLLLVFLVGGLVMVFPAHPGLLFYRLWVFASALGLGLFAQTIVDLARRSLTLLKARSVQDRSAVNRARRTGQVAILSAMAICVILALFYAVAGARSIVRETEVRTTRHEYDLSRDQVLQLLSQATPDATVLYYSLESSSFSSREPMLFYFTHGAMHLKAHTDFIPVDGNAGSVPKADYAVGWNPIMSLPNGRRHGLALKPGEVLEIGTGRPVPASAIALNLARVQTNSTITVEAASSSNTLSKIKIGAVPGWIAPLAQNDALVSSLRISSDAPVDLTGVKLDSTTNSLWPWGDDRLFTVHATNGETFAVSADISELVALRQLQPGCTPTVIDDAGAFLLLRLDSCPDQQPN